ncbi:unnamed protein product, partial [Ectocarpus sp. 12 AP-2014]
GPGEGQGGAEETGATSDAGGSVVRVRQAGQAGRSREESPPHPLQSHPKPPPEGDRERFFPFARTRRRHFPC